jgi:aspartate kinase
VTVVMKFGGAALRDAAGIRRAAAIVAAAGGPRIVVTSAMEGVTDRLLAAQAGAAAGEQHVRPALDDLRSRHRSALEALAPGDAEARAAVDAVLERLERLLYGIAYTQEVTPRLHDLVQSHGERLAAPLVAAAVRQAGRRAVALDGEAARVRSLGPFGNARPDLDALRSECAPALGRHTAAGAVPVVTGYYGVDGAGHATLFGRGGSDYVAALVAFAVRAERLELWKDVAGFLTADPRSVPRARLIPALGYDEAAELANFGAKVLHPRTVEPVQGAGIPIHIRPVADPAGAGTVVQADPGEAQALVRSVARTDGLGILRLNGPGMAYTPGVARRVFGPLADAGINVINMATSQASFALLLDGRDLEGAQRALEALRGGTVQSFEPMGGRSLVCVVGRGLGQAPGSAARILQAVAAAGVNVEMISLGASEIAIDFVVPEGSAARAVQAVHDAFLAA